MPFRRVTLLACAIVLGTVGFLPLPAAASPSAKPELQRQCPQGCTNISKVTSCGSVAAAVSCHMAVNGDVTMGCADGNVYTLDVSGCHTLRNGTGGGGGGGSNGGGGGLDGGLGLKLVTPDGVVRAFISRFSRLYTYMDRTRSGTPHYLWISLLEVVAAVWFSTLAAARLRRFSFFVAGAAIGLVLGLVVASVLEIAQAAESYWNSIPIYAVPTLIAILSICCKTVAAFFYGAASGFMVLVVLASEVAVRAPSATTTSLGNVLYAAVTLVVAGSALARAFPDIGFVFFCALTSSLSLAAALVQLVVSSYHPACQTPANWHDGCPALLVEGIAGGAFVLSFAAQWACVRAEKRRRARELLRREDDDLAAGDLEDESLVSYRRMRNGRRSHSPRSPVNTRAAAAW